MPNLAQDLRTAQGEVVQFPKKEQKTMSIKQDGFTGLPNFICDEGYLSALSGEAIKCLILLNRHITGFRLCEKALAESLIMKITGINDKRTIRKKMDELAKFQLVKMSKCKGKTTKYSITFESRLAVKLVTSDVPSTSNADTFHATSLVTSDVPSTSDMACHPIKEIDLKDKFKEIKKTDVLVDKSKTEMFSESIEYHGKDKTEYSLRDLAGVYTVQSDFMNQAKQINPKLDDEKIMSELKNFAQWSTSQKKTTAQGWMNFWIYRIKNLKTSKPRNSQGAKTENTKPKALSDAQISWFSSELCNYGPFSSRFANMGEKPKEFISRITANLRKPEHVKAYAPYLNDLGFVVSLEEFHAE